MKKGNIGLVVLAVVLVAAPAVRKARAEGGGGDCCAASCVESCLSAWTGYTAVPCCAPPANPNAENHELDHCYWDLVAGYAGCCERLMSDLKDVPRHKDEDCECCVLNTDEAHHAIEAWQICCASYINAYNHCVGCIFCRDAHALGRVIGEINRLYFGGE